VVSWSVEGGESRFRELAGAPSTVEVWPSVLFALLILLASAWLMQTHVRTWQAVRSRAAELEARELDFRRRQFRRRIQTSALLGVVGMGVLVGRLLLVLRAPPLVVLFFWCGVMLLAVWLGLLAVADMVCTQSYFGRLKQNYMIEEARLKAELKRIERTRGNGRAGEEGKRKQPEDPPKEDG